MAEVTRIYELSYMQKTLVEMKAKYNSEVQQLTPILYSVLCSSIEQSFVVFQPDAQLPDTIR